MNHFNNPKILISDHPSAVLIDFWYKSSLIWEAALVGWWMDASSWEWKGGISDGPPLAGSEDPGVPVPLMQWMALPGLKLWGRWWWTHQRREATVKARGAKHVKMPPALRSQKPIYVLPIQGNVRYLVGGTQESTKCRFRGLSDRQQRTLHEIYSGGTAKILPIRPFIVSKLAHFSRLVSIWNYIFRICRQQK